MYLRVNSIKLYKYISKSYFFNLQRSCDGSSKSMAYASQICYGKSSPQLRRKFARDIQGIIISLQISRISLANLLLICEKAFPCKFARKLLGMCRLQQMSSKSIANLRVIISPANIPSNLIVFLQCFVAISIAYTSSIWID